MNKSRRVLILFEFCLKRDLLVRFKRILVITHIFVEIFSGVLCALLCGLVLAFTYSSYRFQEENRTLTTSTIKTHNFSNQPDININVMPRSSMPAHSACGLSHV